MKTLLINAHSRTISQAMDFISSHVENETCDLLVTSETSLDKYDISDITSTYSIDADRFSIDVISQDLISKLQSKDYDLILILFKTLQYNQYNNVLRLGFELQPDRLSGIDQHGNVDNITKGKFWYFAYFSYLHSLLKLMSVSVLLLFVSVLVIPFILLYSAFAHLYRDLVSEG